MSKINSQVIALEESIKKLQEQINLKNREIETLRQQVNRQSGVRIISSGSTCFNCRNKDNEISNLNRTIQELKKNYQNDIKRFNLFSKNQTKIVPRQQSSNKFGEIQAVQRENEQLRRNLESLQSLLRNQRDDQNVTQNIRQQNQNLRRQNQFLSQKVHSLQKILQSIQDSNTILRQQILQNANLTQNRIQNRIQTATFIPPLTTPQNIQTINPVPANTYILQPPPTPNMSSQIHMSSPVNIPVSYSTTHQIPTFTYISPPTVTKIPSPIPSPVPTPRSVSFVFPERREEKVSKKYLSPLAILGNNGASSSSDLDYYKDIVSQRWKSLQYKIRVLQQENGRLRMQVNQPYS